MKPHAIESRAAVVAAFVLLAAGAAAQSQPAPSSQARPTTEPAQGDLAEIALVITGDTLHVRRKGQVEKVHLLSVDTEEPEGSPGASDAIKPHTPFGQECVRWVQSFLAAAADEDGVTRVRLVFPGGVERRDFYGRLLCHVILRDGTDLNLLLVRQGKSPYYNKYGNSLADHAAFVAAQEAARKEKLGIWDPKTNASAGEKRSYDELCAWWQARAEAIDGFRRRKAETPDAVIDCEDPESLARATGSGREIEVFGEIGRILDEKDGGWVVVMRSPAKQREIHVRIPKDRRDSYASLELKERVGTFRQNFLSIRGTLVERPGEYELVASDASKWRIAGPEPETREKDR